MRNWVKRADINSGKRPGLTTEEQRRIAELEREVRELRRANEILKAASAFFAASKFLTPSCCHSTLAPIAIASSAMGMMSSVFLKQSTMSTFCRTSRSDL